MGAQVLVCGTCGICLNRFGVKKARRRMGAQVLVCGTCGTCLNRFGSKDKPAVGSVSNIYPIIDTLSRATRITKP